MLKLALIFCGGGAGALLRYLVHTGMGRAFPGAFPLGTLLVNGLGCFAIGFLVAYLTGTTWREEYRVALLVGVLGGFTTFSTFAAETLGLLQEGAWPLALANVVASSAIALLAVWAGYRLAGA